MKFIIFIIFLPITNLILIFVLLVNLGIFIYYHIYILLFNKDLHINNKLLFVMNFDRLLYHEIKIQDHDTSNFVIK
jgi:hypothetical protein